MHQQTVNAFILLACGLVVDIASADPDHTYLEEGGIVLFEVEDAEPVDGWVLKTDLASYEGSGYFEWSGPNSFPESSAGKGNITYHFRIQTAGNYELKWRSQIGEGNSKTESNDSWVRLATGTDIAEQHPLDGWTKVYMNTLGNWSWVSRTVDHVGEPVRQYFAQGDHTLEISGRSIGHAIDRIALYRYDDVNFSDSEVNRWALSSVVKGDGTVVDPGEVIQPQDPDTGTTDPDETPPVVPVELENLFIAESTWRERENLVCIDDTLALPASVTLSVDPADLDSDYSSADYLTIGAGVSSVLMKFDLSLVPPSESVVIEYSTGTETANGSIRYSLGSHSDWSEVYDSAVQQPNAMLEMGQAMGGWDAKTRYQSILPADLLVNDYNTLILSSDSGSDPVEIFAQTGSELTPRLRLTGNGSFCRDWQVNVDAANAPVEPPAEAEAEEVEVTPPDVESPAETRKVSGGGSLTWLGLLVFSLVVAARRRLTFSRTSRPASCAHRSVRQVSP